jgi:hypothetical protein
MGVLCLVMVNQQPGAAQHAGSPRSVWGNQNKSSSRIGDEKATSEKCKTI